jgi:hypothetical protein
LEAVRFPAKSQTTARRHTMSLPRALLAVVMLDPGRIAEAAEPLELADFGAHVNRMIYAAMVRLHSAGKPIDITLVVGDMTLGISPTFVRENQHVSAEKIPRHLLSKIGYDGNIKTLVETTEFKIYAPLSKIQCGGFGSSSRSQNSTGETVSRGADQGEIGRLAEIHSTAGTYSARAG